MIHKVYVPSGSLHVSSPRNGRDPFREQHTLTHPLSTHTHTHTHGQGAFTSRPLEMVVTLYGNNTHSLTHTHTHTHTHPLTHTHTHTHSPTHSLTHTHTHTLSLSHTHTQVGALQWVLLDKCQHPATILQSGIKSSFPIPLICTTSRRIPVSASTNPVPKKGDLIPL